MRCKKCPMAKDECCTICDQNNFLTAERPSPERDELLAALKREQTINRQLNAIIENSADTLFATNGNGDIIKVNRAWEELSQTNREDVLGRNIRELVSTVISDSSTLATLETKQRHKGAASASQWPHLLHHQYACIYRRCIDHGGQQQPGLLRDREDACAIGGIAKSSRYLSRSD